MKEPLPQSQKFALDAVKSMQSISQPLQEHNCVQFIHDVTFSNGEIVMLMNDQRVLNYYLQNITPAICTNEKGRTLSPGIYLGKVLQENFEEARAIVPTLPLAKQSVHIATQNEDYQQLYSFFFDGNENDFLHWVVNHAQVLVDFIDHYQENMKNLIADAMQKENRMTLPLYVNSQFLNKNPESSQLRIIHHQTKAILYLSLQQSACLRLLVSGQSTKEVALQLNLSTRTIEHYFARIKQMLGCRSSYELISFYQHQV